MSDRDEMVSTFTSITGCDLAFAISFLEGNNWNLEVAVSSFMESSGGGGAIEAGGGGGGGGGDTSNPAALDAGMMMPGLVADTERAPMPQFRDTLIDPALHVPTRMPQQPLVHPQEAFRNFGTEGGGADDSAEPEVFGLSKRPKNLAEIYAAPTELCFMGSFEELRETGRAEGKWLLVNIQSPTEFGSQQLNADTWRDETLRAIIGASFLFWQQYDDSPEGGKYVRHYLKTPTLPHIGVIDPVTGQLVKAWTGFKDAERLMDKLTEYADDPPKAATADLWGAIDPAPSPPRPTAPPPEMFGGGGGGMGASQDPELAAAIAASLEGPNASSASATQALAQPGFAPPLAAPEPEPEPEAEWPEPLPDATGQPGAVVLAVRLPSGGRFQRGFPSDATLHQVFCAVHHCSGHKLKARAYQLTTMGSPPFNQPTATLASLGLVGRLAVNLAEVGG